jgi:tRNA(His) 5'-end guanylyltransferase
MEDEALYYRSLTDYRLMPNGYIIVMCDGRSFSSWIKKAFKLPFDDEFIDMMNKTCEYACSNISGCVLGYTQSDEMTFIIKNENTEDCFFGYRLCKLQSIIASMVTGKFNQLLMIRALELFKSVEPAYTLEYCHLAEFDCKCWNLPTFNDVFGWFLYRQTDCIRNSKQQAAQTYLSHKQLMGKHTDEQIALLKETNNIDWYFDFDDGKKYGRFIYKETVHSSKEVIGKMIEFDRSVWSAHNALPLTEDDNREVFKSLSCFDVFKT